MKDEPFETLYKRWLGIASPLVHERINFIAS